jgi:hypothetical protein
MGNVALYLCLKDSGGRHYRFDIPEVFEEQEEQDMVQAAGDHLTAHKGNPMLMGRDAELIISSNRAGSEDPVEREMISSVPMHRASLTERTRGVVPFPFTQQNDCPAAALTPADPRFRSQQVSGRSMRAKGLRIL